MSEGSHRPRDSALITTTGASDNDRLDPSVWKIAAVALFGGLLGQLDATIVNVSLSNLATDLHSSLSTIQWVTSGYLLALTLALPLNGWLVGRIGAKALYLWSFAGFTLSSALCALAWSANSLIAFRILQGVSGGLLAPMAQMMIAKVAGKHMARVAGYMALPILLAPVLGPVIAGAILQYASWRWLFLVNLPVGALAFVLAVLFLPADREETRSRKLDWLGLALVSPGLALFLFGSDKISQVMGRGIVAAGIVMMAAFLWTAWRKGDDALVDLQLFKGNIFLTASITQFLSNGALLAGQMLIPAFLIQACGRTPGEMGLMLAPLGLGMMVTYPLMGMLTDRFGIRRMATAGPADGDHFTQHCSASRWPNNDDPLCNTPCMEVGIACYRPGGLDRLCLGVPVSLQSSRVHFLRRDPIATPAG